MAGTQANQAPGPDLAVDKAFLGQRLPCSARGWALAALVAAISLSPRIPLPIDIPGRRFDLRVEDLVLVLLLGAWLAARPRINSMHRGVAIAFAAYLLVAFVATAVSVLFYDLPTIRGAAYWGKQLEYLAVFLLVGAWARSAADRRWLLALFLGLGLLNATWVGYQALFGIRRSLLQVLPAFSTYQPPSLYESYGPGLIGEVSPLSTGGFFLAQFLFFFTIFVIGPGRGRIAQVGQPLGVLATMIPVVLSQSRVSIGGSLIGAVTVALATRRYIRAGLAYALALALSVAVLAGTGTPAIKRLLVWRNIENSLTFRASEIWAPVIGTAPEPTPSVSPGSPTAQPLRRPTPPIPHASPMAGGPLTAYIPRHAMEFVLGQGSGAMGSPTSTLPTESSNYYLRVFTESGLLGLLAFIWLLASAYLLLVRGYRRIRDPSDRLIVLGTLATLLGFTGAALLQDMFLPVVPNEVLWYLLGLAAAAVAASRTPASEESEPVARSNRLGLGGD